MPAPELLWDEERAYGALKDWLSFVYGPAGLATTLSTRPPPALPDARAFRSNQDQPAFSGAEVAFLATTPSPVSRSPLSDRTTIAQRQSVLTTVTGAVGGQSYAVSVLDQQTAPYVASVPPDTTSSIRDELRARVDALALPVATADLGAAGFLTTADEAGQHLDLRVVEGATTAQIVDDAGRRRSRVDAWWTVRFRFVDVKGAGAGAPSWARRRAELLEAFMEAGNDVPLPTGPSQPYPYLADVLRTAGLGYSGVVLQVVNDFVKNGVTRYDVASVDVRFTCSRGLDRDVVNLQTVGLQSVTTG